MLTQHFTCSQALCFFFLTTPIVESISIITSHGNDADAHYHASMEANGTFKGQKPAWEQVTDASDQQKELLCNHVAATEEE